MSVSPIINGRGQVVVLGAGISGLAAAWRLSKAIDPSRIVVVEASDRTGGWVQTTRSKNGGIFEHGPRTVRVQGVQGRATLDLLADTGLDQSVLPVTRRHPAVGKRFIYINDNLVPLPSSFWALCRKTPPFTKPLIYHLYKELFVGQQVKLDYEHIEGKGSTIGLAEETVHEFFERRFGSEITTYFVSAFCRGIFAGDSKHLSLRSCFPLLYEMEKKHKSLIRGLLSQEREILPVDSSAIVQQAKREGWGMWTLREGLEQLPSTMAEQLRQRGVDIRLQSPCERLHVLADSCKVELGDETLSAQHVISALPAQVLASVLTSHDYLQHQLVGILSVTVGVVHLQYDGDVLPAELKAFGYLVPSAQPSRVLGVIFDSCTFPEFDGPSGKPSTRFTVMMGGHWFHNLFGQAEYVDKTLLAQQATMSLREHINIQQQPIEANVHILENCIPQYFVGHHSRLDAISSYITERKLPLTLVGASYRGVSVNDCVHSANQAVDQLIS